MRYVLIDYMHLAHRTIVAEPLSTTVNVDGVVEVMETTIPNYTIKNIFRYGGRGLFYTGVFFEGGKTFRKEYFKEESRDGSGYKGDRSGQGGGFYDGINLALEVMKQGKVSLYRAQGYEADDLIYAVIKKIKETDTTTPIDVITNDSDLLPLVDDQVSVYIRGTRQFSEEGCPELRLYYQVTPRTWEEYLSYASAYKGYKIPFNSILLYKLIRGDKSDNVPMGVPGYGAKKYTELMEEMENAVFIEKDTKELLKYCFTERLNQYLKDEELEKIVDAYKDKIKEKEFDRFKETLLKMLKDIDSIPKKDINWMARRTDTTEDVVKYNNMVRDLTKWFNMKELIKDRLEEKDLKVELERVLSTYFAEDEIEKIKEIGLDVENTFTYGIDFPNIFRYGNDFDKTMRPILQEWFTEEEVERMKFIYGGIGLQDANILEIPKQINSGYLQAALSPLQINIIK